MTEPPTSVTLPPTFSNSFWSRDYRSGIESVYSSLENGIVQSQEILSLVQQRVESERSFAQLLLPPALKRDGFASDEGASLRMGFEAILTSTVGESKARFQLADQLMRSVYLPFSKWSQTHASRISESRLELERTLSEWERLRRLVETSRRVYLDDCRELDRVEDELEFVRGREAALLKGPPQPPGVASSAPSAFSNGGHEEDDDQEGREEGSGGGGGIVLPPRPFEIDDQDKQGGGGGGGGGGKSLTNQGSSDDGTLPPVDHGTAQVDKGEGLIDRSGATGGSVVAALGRALTVKRGKNVQVEGSQGRTEEGGGEIGGGGWKVDRLMEDKNVKAALELSKKGFSSFLSKVSGGGGGGGSNQSGEERYVRVRQSVESSELEYKTSLDRLETVRLQLEELYSNHLPYLERCESDRTKAATSVLKSFHSSLIEQVQAPMVQSQERVKQTLELVRTEKDLKLLIERKRTGRFQPSLFGFSSHYSEPYLTTFGIDLLKYDETNNLEREGGGGGGGKVPKVLRVLLDEIDERMENVQDPDERRRSWLYETPLSTQHALRSLLNSPPSTADLPRTELSKLFGPFDLPILCSVVKLWLLELEVPVIPFSMYEELRNLFPGRIISTLTSTTEEDRGGGGVDREGLVQVLGKLPQVHFETLEVLLSHLYPLVELEPSTSSNSDSRQTYLSKLSLSLSRPLVRPKQETALTLDERFPFYVVSLLLQSGPRLLREVETVSKRERDERYKPRRQRTKPIDLRPSRTNLGISTRESLDPRQSAQVLQLHQHHHHHSSSAPSKIERGLPDVPPLPTPTRVGHEEEEDDKEEERRKESLTVETQSLAPPVPIVSPQQQQEEGGRGKSQEFAASPMESISAFPREEDEATRIEPSVVEIEDEKPQVSSSSISAATETPFVPPTSPPSITRDTIESESGNETRLAEQAEDDNKPLTSSTSLKRRSIQQQQPTTTTTSGSRSGASGRLRGARAPRPISSSSSSSSVFDKVKQFEGGK